jgi:hypothetical protein
MTKSLRLFPTYPARPAFGENNKVQNARDYIVEKSTRSSFCNASYCGSLKKVAVATQSDLLLLRKTKYLNYYNSLYKLNNSNYIDKKLPTLTFNKSNLNVNLITKLDLKNVNVISNNITGKSPTPISLNPFDVIPYYSKYKIDPDGLLFGNTICGINNYEDFMVYNPPYLTTEEKHINNL